MKKQHHKANQVGQEYVWGSFGMPEWEYTLAGMAYINEIRKKSR